MYLFYSYVIIWYNFSYMMSPEIRGFITDIDGTLIPEGSMELHSTLETTLSHIRDGVTWTAATGRTEAFSRQLWPQIHVKLPVITENGGTITHPQTGRILRSLNIAQEAVSEVINRCSRIADNAQCRFAGDSFDTTTTVQERKACATKGVFILDIGRDSANEIATNLSGLPVHTFISTSWNEGRESCDVNIYHQRATKGEALQYLGELGILDLEKLIAVGNDVNDLSMFDVVPLTAAPSNAVPEVLERADFIIPPPEENGFIEILERFGFISLK